MPLTGVLTISGGDDSSFVPPKLILTEERHVVGRAAQHRRGFLNIKQPYVSGAHFSIDVIVQTGLPTFELKDLSTNGTFLNGHILGKGNSATLNNGDVISIRFKEVEKVKYTFNLVQDPSEVSLDLPPIDVVNGGRRVEDKVHSDAEYDLLKKQIAILHSEMEESDRRLASATAKREAAQHQLSELLRERDDTALRVAELSDRVPELEAHNSALEARCRVLDDHLAAAKTQLEIQRTKINASTALEIQISELETKLDVLKEEIALKATHAESRQKLLDEINETLAREVQARSAADAQVMKLSAGLRMTNNDLHSSQLVHSSSSLQLEEATRKLSSALATEKNLRGLLVRSQRVILAQRDKLSNYFRAMTALHKRMGEVLASCLTNKPIDVADFGHADIQSTDGKSVIDSQIDELRGYGIAEISVFQSLLGLMESEILPESVVAAEVHIAETCADSLLTSRMHSIVSNANGESQISRIIPNGLESQDKMAVAFDETQAQNCDFGSALPVHFATQQGDSEPLMGNHSTVPPQYYSPSELMSPVTTPPNSAQSPIPSGAKIKYRQTSDLGADGENGVGVRLQLEMGVGVNDNATSILFKRPLDIALESSYGANGSPQASAIKDRDRRTDCRPLKIAKIENGKTANDIMYQLPEDNLKYCAGTVVGLTCSLSCKMISIL